MIQNHREATVKDAAELVNNLRHEDLREVYARGFTPVFIPFSVMSSDICTAFFNDDGELAGIAGIIDEGDGKGEVWMLTTSAIEKNPIKFVKGAKNWLKDHNYRLLWNYVDSRNQLHLKLLKMLGFQAINQVTINNVPFYEVVKLCVSERA